MAKAPKRGHSRNVRDSSRSNAKPVDMKRVEKLGNSRVKKKAAGFK